MPTLFFESRSNIPFCSRCAAYAGMDVVKALAEMASLTLSQERDRPEFIERQLDQYAMALAGAVRNSGCLCPYWASWVRQLYVDAREADLPASDRIPEPITMTRHIWAERQDFVPALDYLVSVAIPARGPQVVPLYGRSAFDDGGL